MGGKKKKKKQLEDSDLTTMRTVAPVDFLDSSSGFLAWRSLRGFLGGNFYLTAHNLALIPFVEEITL